MKFFLVIPDGVGIRNFLFTDFLDRLLEAGEVVVWHALPEASVTAVRSRWDRVRWVRMPACREGRVQRLLRNAKTYSQIYWAPRGEASRVVLFLRAPRGRVRTRLFERASRALGRVFGSGWGTRFLHRAHAAVARRNPCFGAFRDALEQERPDVVFCTHQRASLAVPAVLAARRLGIPAVTFVFSWDNLPKGRMAVHADHFLVWSEHMRDELMDFHPEVPPSAIHVVGTPQFEPYFDEARLVSRESFTRELGLDPDRPIVCFSGDDMTTSPVDQEFLGDLARALRAVPEAERPQLLFRRCPVDWTDRYDEVLAAHPEIAVSDPRWVHHEGDWTQVVPTAEDVDLLANVVHHCDLVVNFASTMAMDFAILGKPAVYVDYDPAGTPLDRWRSRAIYALPHFDTVHACSPVFWARSPEEVGDVVLHALHHGDEKRGQRERWIDTIVARPLDDASRRCREALVRIASAGNREVGGVHARVPEPGSRETGE